MSNTITNTRTFIVAFHRGVIVVIVVLIGRPGRYKQAVVGRQSLDLASQRSCHISACANDVRACTYMYVISVLTLVKQQCYATCISITHTQRQPVTCAHFFKQLLSLATHTAHTSLAQLVGRSLVAPVCFSSFALSRRSRSSCSSCFRSSSSSRARFIFS